MARVTLQTIADRVGVSRMTVSNAFSRPDQLSPALRERILTAAEELGYVGPDPTARALARGSAGAVGVLLTESLREAFTDEIATGFLGAVAEQLGPTGLALTLLTTFSGSMIPARDVAIDGAIVYSCVPESQALQWLRRRRLPLVYVDQSPVEGAPSVNIDDRAGARAAARHLVDLGHRRIGIVTANIGGPYGPVEDPQGLGCGPGCNHVMRERVQGWLEELTAAGVDPSVVIQPPFGASVEGSAALLLDRPDRPTAILCFSDVLAVGVILQARARGLRVPEDLSVVGFDDAPLAARTTPALTTVRQDVDAKGRAAAAALTGELARRSAPAGSGADGDALLLPQDRRIVLPVELVVRDSTAPPPA
ncbi:MAG TPA: LacI family DNA-binding transcriptional regulator [Kineosporiaceae bacterium]|nr:LacI family DNA-binding transcriptional regulator [Kineosporiaceae bacterium]